MWIHKRTDENTAVSYRLGPIVFGLFVLFLVLVDTIRTSWSPAFLLPVGVVAVLAVGVWLRIRAGTRDEREHDRLAAMERTEIARTKQEAAAAARQADLRRLRNKYQA
jgi:hypothetical protein